MQISRLDFTNGEGTSAMVEGDVNMWFYDHKSGEGVGLQTPAVAVDNLRKKILSIPVIVKVLGFRCELSPGDGDFEGLYRVDPMIGDNRNARDWAMEDVMADGNMRSF